MCRRCIGRNPLDELWWHSRKETKRSQLPDLPVAVFPCCHSTPHHRLASSGRPCDMTLGCVCAWNNRFTSMSQSWLGCRSWLLFCVPEPEACFSPAVLQCFLSFSASVIFMQLVMTASYWQLCLFIFFFSFSTLCPLIKNSYSLQGEEALLSARWQTQTQVLNREQGKYYSRPQRPMKIWTLQKVAWNWTFAVMLNIYSFGCWNANQNLLPVVIT